MFPLGVRTSLAPRWIWQRYDQQNGRLDYLQQELLVLGHRLDRASTASLVFAANPGLRTRSDQDIKRVR